MTMPKQTLAAHVLIDHEAGTVTIDGQEFPWHLHADAPTIDRDPLTPELATVHLPVLVLGEVVEVTTFEQDLAWIVSEGERQRAEALADFHASCQGRTVLLQRRGYGGGFESIREAMLALGRALTDPLRGPRRKDQFTLVTPR